MQVNIAADKRIGHGCPEAFGKAVSKAFMGGEIDNIVLLDDFTCHIFRAAQAIGKTHLNAGFATPEQAAEYFRRFFEAIAAAFTHNCNKLLVNLIKHCLLYTSPSPRDGLLSR